MRKPPKVDFLVGIFTYTLLFTGYFFFPEATFAGSPHRTLAITQIIDHPALNEEREALLGELAHLGFKENQNLKVYYFNANGNLSTSTQIAQKIVGLKPDVVVALSTPAAQSVLAATKGKNIPMVFSAVTDAYEARLLKRDQTSDEWVTGVCDHLLPETQVELIQKFMPKLKKVGIIYNSGEINSAIQVDEFEKKAHRSGITVIRRTIQNTGEASGAALALVGKAEAIYIPTDNTAVAAIDTIIRVGTTKKIPVFVADSGSFHHGAVALRGYSRADLGREAAKRVLEILKGKSPREIPMGIHFPARYFVNKKAAEKMGVDLPVSFPPDTEFFE